jgi:O-antigen biosynthesis protein
MKTRKKLIVVIGMHRSGTSAVTRGVNALGVSLGQDFLPTMPEVNAKGFWEDRDLNAINIELLRMFDTDWYHNRPIHPSQFQRDDLAPLLLQAISLIEAKLADQERFAFKDPRTAILLPFWHNVFSALNVDLAYVIAVRHPKSIADSLAKRNGFDPLKSYLLWLRYTLPTILETSGVPRVFVDYDLLIDDPRSQLRRISKVIMLGDGNPKELERFATAFLTDTLRHSQYAGDVLQTDDTVPGVVAETFAMVAEFARDASLADTAAVIDHFRQVHEFLVQLTPVLAYMDRLEQLSQASSGTDQTARELIEGLEVALQGRNGLVTQQHRDLEDARNRLTQAEQTVNALGLAVAAIHASTSWRLTAPLRRLKLGTQKLLAGKLPGGLR